MNKGSLRVHPINGEKTEKSEDLNFKLNKKTERLSTRLRTQDARQRC